MGEPMAADGLDTRPSVLVHNRDGNLVERPISLDDWLGTLPTGLNPSNPMRPHPAALPGYQSQGKLVEGIALVQPAPELGATLPAPLGQDNGRYRLGAAPKSGFDELESVTQQQTDLQTAVPGMPAYPELRG